MINKKDIELLRNRYIKEESERDMLGKSLKQAETELLEHEQVVLACQKTRAIIQVVAKETQKKIEFQISNLVTLALSSVFADPYEFKLRYEERRNKTEADLLFIKRGHEGNPEDVAGGGTLDIADFALRCAVWSIKPTNNVMILDEPSRNLSRDLQIKCSQMIKMLNKKLRIQFIVVSHIPEITESADKIINVYQVNGVSKIS